MTRDTAGQVYEMDPAHRPDREMVAKEIDKLDGGRPVTHYDVLAWMQVLIVSPAAYHICRPSASGVMATRQAGVAVSSAPSSPTRLTSTSARSS